MPGRRHVSQEAGKDGLQGTSDPGLEDAGDMHDEMAAMVGARKGGQRMATTSFRPSHPARRFSVLHLAPMNRTGDVAPHFPANNDRTASRFISISSIQMNHSEILAPSAVPCCAVPQLKIKRPSRPSAETQTHPCRRCYAEAIYGSPPGNGAAPIGCSCYRDQSGGVYGWLV